MTIGEKIATLRKQNNFTQEDLADKLSVTPQAVSKWENDITSPDISLLPIIANLFHITTDELLGVSAPKVYQSNDLTDISKLMLKIKVLSGEGDKVNVNLPFSVATTLLASGGNFNFGKTNMSDIDWKSITEVVTNGVRGKIVDVTSADGDIVEIVVE